MGIRKLVALCMLALLAACRQPTTKEIEAIVQGSSNVQIETLQIVPDDTVAAAKSSPPTVYYVCKVLFVNGTSADVTPALDHFVFVAAPPLRGSYRALTGGLPPSLAISNPPGAVRAGDKQEYTLVFHPATGATGTLAYQP
jgi:hypothetical protein